MCVRHSLRQGLSLHQQPAFCTLQLAGMASIPCRLSGTLPSLVGGYTAWRSPPASFASVSARKHPMRGVSMPVCSQVVVSWSRYTVGTRQRNESLYCSLPYQMCIVWTADSRQRVGADSPCKPDRRSTGQGSERRPLRHLPYQSRICCTF